MPEILLTQGLVTKVSDRGHALVASFKWCAKREGRRVYATRRYKNKMIYLHRVLMGSPGGFDIDHIDGDGLNNYEHNLRVASRRQNLRGFRKKVIGSSSKFRGVSWVRRQNIWQARIKNKGRDIFLGHFVDEKQAAQAYDVAARKYFGSFASPNFSI